MRPANWFHLLVLCLIAGSVLAPRVIASRTIQRGPKEPPIKEEFQGYGKSIKDAETHALEQACDWMGVNPNLGWKPTPEFLRSKGMVRFGEPTEKEFEKAGPMQVVAMQLEITDDQKSEIQKHAREERMPSRHLLLARVLGGVVCLLIVMGGYLRLEEATKGYYTRLLRLAAITFLIVVGVGLCVIG
ncbi:MAG TPA: hypothetical protein VH575_09225 [Gemmataceae bacterium]|jgi:hypothetical protein